MDKELEQYSAAKLARAEIREQKRMNEANVLDYFLDCARANGTDAGDLLHRVRRLELRLARSLAKIR